MAWVSEAEALELTGVEVTDAQIAVAQGVINLFSGVNEDVENLHARDQRLLLQATAYQAVWMVPQIDVLTRTEVKVIEQDGVKVTPGEPADLTLAPLAKLALSQLSWNRRNRSHLVRAPRPERGQYRTFEAWAAAWLRDDDCSASWRPM